MYSFWHRNILGKYNPQDRWIGLDFRSLFLNPVAAKLTHIHELVHSVLFRSTDFGQATQAIYQFLPLMKHLSRQERKEVITVLRNSQIFLQEGAATLMEILILRKDKGKQFALNWAKGHLNREYYQKFSELSFVLDLSKRYRENFTKKIPHLALHTAIRKNIVKKDLFSNIGKFTTYLAGEDNNPDIRFKKMVDVIKYKTYLVTKKPAEICRETGIKLH